MFIIRSNTTGKSLPQPRKTLDEVIQTAQEWADSLNTKMVIIDHWSEELVTSVSPS